MYNYIKSSEMKKENKIKINKEGCVFLHAPCFSIYFLDPFIAPKLFVYNL